MASYSVNDRELKRSLNLVISSISFGMVFFAVVGNPVGSPIFTGFMRKLGAGDFIYSVVLALPALGGVSQIFGSYFLEKTGKRRFQFLACGLVNRALWIPVALIPVFFGENYHNAIIWAITVLITVSSLAGAINNVAFNSWMGALVPSDIIGRFFGLRSLISTAAGGAAALIVGYATDKVNNLAGFAVIFALGAVFGVMDITTYFFIRHPPLESQKESTSMMSIIVEPLKNKNYLGFVLFATVFAFAVNFSGPFFNVYMIEQLKMNYFWINLSNQVMSSVGTILVVRRWGSLADRFGNRPVTLINAIIIIIVPFMWVFTSSTNYSMTFIVNFVSGIGWAGYNLVIFNLSVWLAPERNRSAYLACYALLTSVVGTAAAYICGGIFMQYLTPVFARADIPFVMGMTFTAYPLLFIVSGALRVVAVAIFFPMFREKNASSTVSMLTHINHSVREQIARKAS